jgi:UrcA family protein
MVVPERKFHSFSFRLITDLKDFHSYRRSLVAAVTRYTPYHLLRSRTMNKSSLFAGSNTVATRLAMVAFLAVPLVPAAYADSSSYSESISLKGLDLDSMEGASIALKRAEKASERICAHLKTSLMDLKGSQQFSECVDSSYKGIVTELDKVFDTDVIALSEGVNEEEILALSMR